MQETELDVPENKVLRYAGVAFVSVLLATLVLKGLDLIATASQPRIPKPPTKLPETFVLRPEFETATGKTRGGTAFAVRLQGDARRVVLTARHLVENTTGGAPADVKKVFFRDAFGVESSVPMGSAASFLDLPSAPHGKTSEAGDVAALWAGDDSYFATVSLATENPVKGDSIWLVCPILNAKGDKAKQRFHRAVVEGVAEGDLVYWFDNAQLDLTATNGAPLVNESGEVVGINLGGGPEGGRMSGFGNPVERFRGLLKTAVTATPDKGAIKSDPVKRPPPPPPK
jgi:hypothetical protein